MSSRRQSTKIALEDRRNSHTVKQMVTRGLSKQVFSIPAYNLEERVQSFTSDIQGLKAKRITRDNQLDNIKKIIANPFYGPYVCCISGKPHDVQAKLLAAFIMMRATNLQMSATEDSPDKTIFKKTKDKALPVWHTLLGGFDNILVSKESNSTSRPSLLILSNVTLDSTAPKIEKLRDILEFYSTIPRIVVVSGTDPLTFFHSKLYMSLNASCFLASNLVKKPFEQV